MVKRFISDKYRPSSSFSTKNRHFFSLHIFPELQISNTMYYMLSVHVFRKSDVILIIFLKVRFLLISILLSYIYIYNLP